MSIDYGPLTGLIGTWKGDKGLDVSPEPSGSVDSPYYETLEFGAAGDVENYEQQKLAIVSYHQVVTRKRCPKVLCDISFYASSLREAPIMQRQRSGR